MKSVVLTGVIHNLEDRGKEKIGVNYFEQMVGSIVGQEEVCEVSVNVKDKKTVRNIST